MNIGRLLNSASARLTWLLVAASMILSACGDDRGGVIVDSTGEQGGGTQPGGGGFAFVMLFLVVAGCALAMFTMDRIKKTRSESDSDRNSDSH